jgi:hypothetical protein
VVTLSQLESTRAIAWCEALKFATPTERKSDSAKALRCDLSEQFHREKVRRMGLTVR